MREVKMLIAKPSEISVGHLVAHGSIAETTDRSTLMSIGAIIVAEVSKISRHTSENLDTTHTVHFKDIHEPTQFYDNDLIVVLKYADRVEG
jgi:hypothetical protein